MGEEERVDLAIVGAGAAGLMAGIAAARAAPGRRIVLLDGARRVGAKILVAGGGRCNVTHERVSASDFNGSRPRQIERVLKAFGVEETIAFFRQIGVALKREETGKLFPTTDRAETVLGALLDELARQGADLRTLRRVLTVEPLAEGFRVGGEWGGLRAQRVILATGGAALPKSGSDGFGYQLAARLGHRLTPHRFPALAPLVVAEGHWVRRLSGVSAEAGVEVRTASGKRTATAEGSLLCTHFGLSGPAALDISRHLTEARLHDPGAELFVNWLPRLAPSDLHERLQSGKGSVRAALHPWLPQRLAEALCLAAGVPPETALAQLARARRASLVDALVRTPMPVTGDRGYKYAEATAGGAPLAELNLATMESRIAPGVYLCGELCDVDGRIGGFNFAWAWASGFAAGSAAGAALGTSAAEGAYHE